MKNEKKDLALFLGGIAMLIAGLVIFCLKVEVRTGIIGGLYLGGFHLTSGLMVVPLIIGIVMLFATKANLASKIVTGVGVLIILVCVIASTTVRLETISLFEWIIILILIFGGAGLLVRTLFALKPEKEKSNTTKKDVEDKMDSVEAELEQMKKK